MKTLALALFLTTASCAAVVQALPIIVAAVQDSTMILDTIERFVHSRPGDHADVYAKIEKARIALSIALRTAQGADKLDQAQIDAAFADFKIAYTELIVLSEPLGVHVGRDRLSASPGSINVPEPLALTLKIKR